jgi:hypothetical protein
VYLEHIFFLVLEFLGRDGEGGRGRGRGGSLNGCNAGSSQSFGSFSDLRRLEGRGRRGKGGGRGSREEEKGWERWREVGKREGQGSYITIIFCRSTKPGKEPVLLTKGFHFFS